MQSNFPACLAKMLAEEGAYSDDPRDPGGATMEGITQATYDAWRRLQGKALKPVRGISADEIEAIYRAQYWNAVHGDELAAGVDLATFDGGVNSGPVRAVKWLQAAIGTAADGHYGVKTAAAVAAIREPAKVITGICSRRLSFLEALRNWKIFGTGWGKRVARIQAEALTMVAPQAIPAATVAHQAKAGGASVGTVTAAGAGLAVAANAGWLDHLAHSPVAWAGFAALAFTALFLAYQAMTHRWRASALTAQKGY